MTDIILKNIVYKDGEDIVIDNSNSDLETELIPQANSDKILTSGAVEYALRGKQDKLTAKDDIVIERKVPNITNKIYLKEGGVHENKLDEELQQKINNGNRAYELTHNHVKKNNEKLAREIADVARSYYRARGLLIPAQKDDNNVETYPAQRLHTFQYDQRYTWMSDNFKEDPSQDNAIVFNDEEIQSGEDYYKTYIKNYENSKGSSWTYPYKDERHNDGLRGTNNSYLQDVYSEDKGFKHRAYIDCSSFIGLVLRGIPFNKSPYTAAINYANSIYNNVKTSKPENDSTTTNYFKDLNKKAPSEIKNGQYGAEENTETGSPLNLESVNGDNNKNTRKDLMTTVLNNKEYSWAVNPSMDIYPLEVEYVEGQSKTYGTEDNYSPVRTASQLANWMVDKGWEINFKQENEKLYDPSLNSMGIVDNNKTLAEVLKEGNITSGFGAFSDVEVGDIIFWSKRDNECYQYNDNTKKWINKNLEPESYSYGLNQTYYVKGEYRQPCRYRKISHVAICVSKNLVDEYDKENEYKEGQYMYLTNEKATELGGASYIPAGMYRCVRSYNDVPSNGYGQDLVDDIEKLKKMEKRLKKNNSEPGTYPGEPEHWIYIGNYKYRHSMIEATGTEGVPGMCILNTCLERKFPSQIACICRPDLGALSSSDKGSNIVPDLNVDNEKEKTIDDFFTEGTYYLTSEVKGGLPDDVSNGLGLVLKVTKTLRKNGQPYSIIQELIDTKKRVNRKWSRYQYLYNTAEVSTGTDDEAATTKVAMFDPNGDRWTEWYVEGTNGNNEITNYIANIQINNTTKEEKINLDDMLSPGLYYFKYEAEYSNLPTETVDESLKDITVSSNDTLKVEATYKSNTEDGIITTNVNTCIQTIYQMSFKNDKKTLNSTKIYQRMMASIEVDGKKQPVWSGWTKISEWTNTTTST